MLILFLVLSLFLFLPSLAPLSFYIQNSPTCKQSAQTGSIDTPFCSIPWAFDISYYQSLNSTDSEISYVLMSPSYQIFDPNLPNPPPYFLGFSGKNVSIVSENSSVIILETNNVCFGVANNLTIVNVSFQGGAFFQPKRTKQEFYLNYQLSSFIFSSLFVFIPSTKVKFALFYNSTFSQFIFSRNESFSSLLLMNDNMTLVTFYNSSFETLFFSHSMIYSPKPLVTVTAISIGFFNCSFLNYNILDHKITFLNFPDETLQPTHKFMFGFNKGKIYLVGQDLMIQNISNFCRNSETNIYLRNVIIKNSPSNSESRFFWMNSSTLNINTVKLIFSNGFIHLEQKNTLVIKFFYLQTALSVPSLFNLTMNNSMNLQNFYIDSINIISTVTSFLNCDKNSTLYMNNVFLVHIQFLRIPLMYFFKANTVLLYNFYLIGCASYKSVIQVGFTNNVSNSILIKSLIVRNTMLDSFMSGSIYPDFLKISNLDFNNSLIKDKMNCFLKTSDLSRLTSNAVFTNATFIAFKGQSFASDLIQSNITFENTVFLNMTLDLGFVSMTSGSSLSLITTKFLSVINGNDYSFSPLLGIGFFVKVNSGIIYINSVVFDGYNATQSFSRCSIFFLIIDKNTLKINDLLIKNTGQNTTFLSANTFNNVDLAWVNISLITVKNPRNFIKIESDNSLYFKNCSFTQIKIPIAGAFMSANQNNAVWIKSTTVDGIFAKDEGKGGCFAFNSNNTFTLLKSNFSNITASYGSLGYFGFKNFLTLESCFIRQLTATKTAAGLFFTESNIIRIFNSNFSDTHSIQDSGLIFLSLNNQLTLINVWIVNSNSDLCGGTIYGLTDNIVGIDDCKFITTRAVLSGGLFYFASSNNIVMNNNYVYNSTASRFSYAIDLNRFNNMTSIGMIWEQSDGIYNGYMGSVILRGWEAQGKIKEDSSLFPQMTESNIMIGFLSCFNSLLTISDIDLYNYQGFLLLFAQGGSIKIVGFKVRDTSSLQHSIFEIQQSYIICTFLNFRNITGSIFHLTDSISMINSSKVIGSGFQFLQAISSVLYVSKSYFLYPHNEMSAPVSLPTNGGFFELIGSEFTLRESTLVGGFAVNGGAISLEDSEMEFHNNVCLMNKATMHGGCLYISHNNEHIFDQFKNLPENERFNRLKFSGNLLFANNARLGGGFLIHSHYMDQKNKRRAYKILADRNIFKSNKANKGGAMFKDEMSVINASNLIFRSNLAYLANKTSVGKGGAVYTNCSFKCDLGSEIFWNVSFEKNRATFGGAVFLEQNPYDLYNMQAMIHNNITFNNNKGYSYGNDLATIPAWISLKTRDSDIEETYMSIKNLVSGNNYPCLFYITGKDYFGNLVIMQENPIALHINDRNNNSDHQLILVPEYNNLLCAKNTIISNPRPNLNLIYDINFANPEASSSHVRINLTFRSCEIGERQTDDFRCESCAMGSYSFQQNSSEKCLPCDDTLPFYCLGSSFVGPKPSYWRMDYYSDNFIRCPNPSSCLGYNVSNSQYFEKSKSTGLCREGYKGVLCAECAEGYGITNGYFCTSCGSFWYYFNIIFFFSFRLFLIIYSLHSAVAMCTSAAAGLLKTKEIISATIMKILMNHFQVLNIILSFPMEWKQNVYEFLSIPMAVSPSISDSYSVQCLFQFLNINISTHFVKIINIWLSILFLMGVCYAYYKFYLTKKIKFYLKFIKKTENDVIESTYIIILFIVYLDILSVCLETFSCRNIGYKDVVEYRLVKDYSVKCWNENHKGWAYGLVVPFLILFGIGFPISILYVLVHKQKKKKLNRQDLMLRYGYFYLSYEREYFYWDFVILSRKIVISAMNIFVVVLFTKVFSYIVTIMLVILLIYLYLQIECRPYLNKELKSVNNLEKLSLVSLSGTMFISIFGVDAQFSKGSELFLILAVAFNSSFFIAWGILYYESDFKKTLKTVLYFSCVCVKSLYYTIKECCTVENLQQNFSRRRRGIFKNKDGAIIFDDLERYLHEMEEIEISDGINKYVPVKNFHLQLDFTYFNLENAGHNSKKKPAVQFRRLHSTSNFVGPQQPSFERISSSPNDSSVPNRYSKFFTIDSSPKPINSLRPSGNRPEIENLRVENQLLNDNLKKAKKEIHNLKYLFLMNQELSVMEGKEQMDKEFKDDQFFLQELLINYENFLKKVEENTLEETNKRAMIQNEGVLFKDEIIQISFISSLHKIRTNNPQVSIKFRIANVSYVFVQSIKIKYSDSEFMQIFPEIDDVTLLQNQYVNQNVVVSYKTALYTPLNFSLFYQIRTIEVVSRLTMPISLWTLVSLIQSNQVQFISIWRTMESIKVKHRSNCNEKFPFEKVLRLFQSEESLFQNFLIPFTLDLRNSRQMEEFKDNVAGKFGLMMKTLHDGKLYMIKFIFKNDVIRIVSKVQKNDVESFRFLEAIIDTILISLR